MKLGLMYPEIRVLRFIGNVLFFMVLAEIAFYVLALIFLLIVE